MMAYFDSESFVASMTSQCFGKQICAPKFAKDTIFKNLPVALQHENMLLFAQVGCA